MTEKREINSHYDWRRDLVYKIHETKGNSDALASMGIILRKRKSKKYPPAVTSFAFTDKNGKKRNIRGQQLASQLGMPLTILMSKNYNSYKQISLNILAKLSQKVI